MQVNSAKVEFSDILMFFQIIVIVVSMGYDSIKYFKTFKTICSSISNTLKDENSDYLWYCRVHNIVQIQNHDKRMIFQNNTMSHYPTSIEIIIDYSKRLKLVAIQVCLTIHNWCEFDMIRNDAKKTEIYHKNDLCLILYLYRRNVMINY